MGLTSSLPPVMTGTIKRRSRGTIKRRSHGTLEWECSHHNDEQTIVTASLREDLWPYTHIGYSAGATGCSVPSSLHVCENGRTYCARKRTREPASKTAAGLLDAVDTSA
jgi:hypothetical protein